jgi:hypothetical protein
MRRFCFSIRPIIRNPMNEHDGYAEIEELKEQ